MAFDKYAKRGAYHWRNMDLDDWRAFNAVVSARYEYVLELIPHNVARVLDVGCGDGYLLHCLAKMGKEIWGLDLSFEGLFVGRVEHRKHLNEYPAYLPFLVQASAFDLPFGNNTFDCILLTEVLEHLHKPGKLLEEIKRALTQSGWMILSTPNRMPTGLRDPHHVQEYSPQELEDLLFQFFPFVQIHGLGNITLCAWYKSCLHHIFLRRLTHLACKMKLNPFLLTQNSAKATSNMLFAVCQL